ncbi:MAG: hypothetical protein HY816_18825 [Candidatus Wallbacteria bacterium]|nr:hypothetical protein [Candidatus Wallbacteria bacterium]
MTGATAMLSREESRRALRRLFRGRPIADMPLLLQTLRTDASRSVFRRLGELGYLSSYNENGRFYTLEEIPEFDAHGLWEYQGVFFSRHGALNVTIAHLVEEADSGYTHGELVAVLHVRVHNMLLELVKRAQIARELLGGLFVYVSAESRRAGAQLNRRHEQETTPARPASVLGQPLEIAVLLEVIHGARRIPGPDEIAKRLAGKGQEVSLEQVEAIFHKHGVKKTPSPHSRSSRP